MKIRPYQASDERSWVYTKALAYLFSEFFDDHSRAKDSFSPELYEETVELVAVENDQVIGLLDIAIYNPTFSQSYKYHPANKVAYFANLAVHPDHQGKGIADQLFTVAEQSLKEKGVEALAIFTRGDGAANHLYQKWGASLVCRDFLVVGRRKTDVEDFLFQVKRDDQRLAFVQKDGTELPAYLREGQYIVAREEDLALFEVDEVYEERTYIKVYE